MAALRVSTILKSPESFSMGTSPKVDGCAPIHVFASSKSWIEGNATLQLDHVAALPGVRTVAAMPDLHPGKYGPVGCAILAERIHPQLVGSDIGCGMGLFALDIAARKLRARPACRPARRARSSLGWRRRQRPVRRQS